MLTWENSVEAAALKKQGWTISAIARHLGHDRKTTSVRRPVFNPSWIKCATRSLSAG